MHSSGVMSFKKYEIEGRGVLSNSSVQPARLRASSLRVSIRGLSKTSALGRGGRFLDERFLFAVFPLSWGWVLGDSIFAVRLLSPGALWGENSILRFYRGIMSAESGGVFAHGVG